jgi:hypothetical protein
MTGDRDRQTDRAKPLALLGRSGDLVPMSLEAASNGRLLTTALGQAARHRFDQGDPSNEIPHDPPATRRTFEEFSVPL